VPFNTNTLKLLIKGELWFGKPYNLNDPFESQFKMSFEGVMPNDDFLNKYYLNELKIEDALIERINRNKENVNFFLNDIYDSIQKRIFNQVGICSFSTVYNDIKMWSYYADDHKGLCLVFDRDLLRESIGSSIKESQICYENELPVVKVIGDTNNIELEGDDLIKIVNTKLREWDGEKEIRYSLKFYNPDTRRLLPFDKRSLKGIIFGQKIDPDNAGTIFHLLHEDKELLWAKALKDLDKSKMDVHYTSPSIHNGYNFVTF
jgi:hypothetical protein